MSIEGFKLADKGPAAGLVWVTFSNIQVHGDRGTREYLHGMMQKGQVIAKVITTELKIGTRHFSKDLTELKTPMEVLRSYKAEGGVYVELKGRPREKLEALAGEYGIDRVRDERPQG